MVRRCDLRDQLRIVFLGGLVAGQAASLPNQEISPSIPYWIFGSIFSGSSSEPIETAMRGEWT